MTPEQERDLPEALEWAQTITLGWDFPSEWTRHIDALVAAARERTTVPIRLRFDFKNSIDAFGAMVRGEGEPEIYVNMAAILWVCADNPELEWREIVSDTTVHELLHIVQLALGRLVREDEIDAAIEAARGGKLDESQSADKECDPVAEATKRAEEAEAKVREMQSTLEAAVEAERKRCARFVEAALTDYEDDPPVIIALEKIATQLIGGWEK